MIQTLIYYLGRLGLVFKRGYYLFYLLDCSRKNDIVSGLELVEVKAQAITADVIFGWLTVDEARSLISTPFNRMFLLKEDNEPIASCWVQTQRAELRFIEVSVALPKKSAYISHVIVKPHHRGCGAARKLLDQLVQSLKQEGIENIFLCIDYRNTPMQKVIHKIGFMPYLGIRYFRALFIRRYFVQNEMKQDSKWQRIIDGLPPDLHLIDIYFDNSLS